MNAVSLILALVQLALKFADWAEARSMFNAHQKQFFEELIHQQAEALKLYQKHAADFNRDLDDSRLREDDEHLRTED